MQEQLITNIIAGGTTGLVSFLLTTVVAVIRGWWVPGYLYREQGEELARYRDLAFRSISISERLAGKDGPT